MKQSFLKKMTALLLGTIMVLSMIPAIAIGANAAGETYELVTSVDDLEAGATYLIVCSSKGMVMGAQDNTKYRSGVEVKINSDNTITNVPDTAQRVVLGGSVEDDWTLKAGDQYLSWTSGNELNTKSTAKDWTISFSGDNVNICDPTATTRKLQWNASSPRFACYTSTQTAVQLFKLVDTNSAGCDHIDENDDCKCDNGCGYEFEHEFVNVGDPVAPTCTEAGYQLQECKCGEENKVEGDPATGHKFVGSTCSDCGITGQSYTKVESDLTDFTGRYLIVYEQTNLAFNGSLETLDDGKNGIAVELNNKSIVGDYSKYVFTIAKTSDGNYTIQSASGFYIGQTTYANGLKSNDQIQYKHTISIDADGNAVIIALDSKDSGSGNMTTLRYNNAAGDNNLRFRYYKSGQQPIALYKLDEAVTPEPETPCATVESFGVTLNKGVTVRVTLNIDAAWLEANSGAMVEFSNGEKIAAVAGTKEYMTTLTPGMIASELTVKVGNVTENVSFAAYKERIEAKTASALGISDAKFGALKNLLSAIEAYGDVAANNTAVETPTFNDATLPAINGELEVFGENIEAELREYANAIIDVIKVEDGMTYSISFGGNKVAGGKFADIVNEDSKLIIENLRPANFNDEIAITVTDAAGATATAFFNFNGYLKAVYDDNPEYKNLAAAAYNYGVATEAYHNAQ